MVQSQNFASAQTNLPVPLNTCTGNINAGIVDAFVGPSGLGSSAESSKLNAYAILQTGMGTSKLNSYAILVPGISTSKLNLYAVTETTPPTPAPTGSGLGLFHAFPP